MNILIFDTETTDIKKPFCYNIGYVIVNTDTWQTILKKEYVIEQVWYNQMLFTTAYYADKRQQYVGKMRSRQAKLEKFGYACQAMIRDIKNYNVEIAYAFNSSFDERVFQFNCDWYKCNNPFESIPIYDIRGYANRYIADMEYLFFCDKYGLYTDSERYYQTNAESYYRYIIDDIEFIEAHTGLDDAIIEAEILRCCVELGADITQFMKAVNVERPLTKPLTIVQNKEVVFATEYEKIRISKDKTKITLT